MTGLLFLLTVGAVSAEGAKLDENDMVGVSFWLATAMMLASTVFFIMERNNVAAKWKTSMTVAALVTGVAWYHYTYMREHWATTYADGAGESPLVMRYIDWLITVPLQVAEFYLILAAVGAATAMLFWRLFGASLVMLIAGFLGEAEKAPEMPMLIVGCVAWAYTSTKCGLATPRKAPTRPPKEPSSPSRPWPSSSPLDGPSTQLATSSEQAKTPTPML